MRRLLTYGTYGIMRFGHIRLPKRTRALGDDLIVGLSTEALNDTKNKHAHHSWEERKAHLEAQRYVDLVIPDDSWEQKADDIKLCHFDVFTMGSHWEGEFGGLRVVRGRLSRTDRGHFQHPDAPHS